RPAKQVGGQRWLNQHSLNRGSSRTKLVLCAVSASPECLMNHGELRRLRTGSPAHCPRPSGSDSASFVDFGRGLPENYSFAAAEMSWVVFRTPHSEPLFLVKCILFSSTSDRSSFLLTAWLPPLECYWR